MVRSRSILLAPLRIFTLTSNPCRLCTELDGYSDAECLRFAIDLTRVRLLGITVALVLIVFIGAPVMIGVQVLLNASVPPKSVWADTETWQGRALVLFPGVMSIVLVVWGAFLPYCIMLRSAVRGIFRGLVCRKCLYSLVGLPIAGGIIRCPECALPFVLADNGFPDQDPETHRPEPRALLPLPLSVLHVWFAHTWIGAFVALVLVSVIFGPVWLIVSAVLLLTVRFVIRAPGASPRQ